MEVSNSKIPDCKIIHSFVGEDSRGKFNKMFVFSKLQDLNIEFNIKESYLNSSKKDVIRGMHFQNPPYDHQKLVSCIGGKVLDVFLDIRKNSKTFGKFQSVELKESDNLMVYLPKGIAHGFLALEDNSKLLYYTDSEYKRDYDTGIRWDSFGFDWNIVSPIISKRDLSFILFKDFNTFFK